VQVRLIEEAIKHTFVQMSKLFLLENDGRRKTSISRGKAIFKVHPKESLT